MARNVRVFDVFVASPADVADERERLESVILELNNTLLEREGIQLNLIRWETHTYPGFADDAQDVINQEMPDSCDVFIGVLWSRVGTPTNRADSGTLEEFERAYSQWKIDPNSIKILIYFKTAPVDFEKIDPEQISKVKEFKKSLGAKGALFSEFSSAGEFEGLVRKHITLLSQKLASDTQRGKVQTEVYEPQEEVDEDEGLFDLIDQYQDGMSSFTSIVTRLTESTKQLGQDIVQETANIESLDVRNNPTDVAEAKRLINSMANRLDFFTNALMPETPVLSEAFRRSIRALDKSIELAPDFGDDGIRNVCEVKPALVEFEKAIAGGMDSVAGMKGSIDKLPRVTTRFNRAKRRSVGAISKLYESLDSARAQLQSSLALIDQLCARKQAPSN